jgi:hypothetical protein
MEKVDVGNNEVYDILRKNHFDVNNQINQLRNIFKNKFNSCAKYRIDNFLEDDFVENLFNFMEKQDDLLMVSSKLKIFRNMKVFRKN